MARHATLAAGLARLFARPLVRRPLLMRGLAALARDLSLLVPVHRRKSTILFCQGTLQLREHSGCNRDATMPDNLQVGKDLGSRSRPQPFKASRVKDLSSRRGPFRVTKLNSSPARPPTPAAYEPSPDRVRKGLQRGQGLHPSR